PLPGPERETLPAVDSRRGCPAARHECPRVRLSGAGVVHQRVLRGRSRQELLRWDEAPIAASANAPAPAVGRRPQRDHHCATLAEGPAEVSGYRWFIGWVWSERPNVPPANTGSRRRGGWGQHDLQPAARTCPVLHPAVGREPVDSAPVCADDPAHRAACVASNVNVGSYRRSRITGPDGPPK